jgi:uncharacterized membrane protein
MQRFKTPLRYLLSLNLCGAGFMHLLNPDFFVAIIPAGLPDPEWLNVLSGLAEIILGVFLLEPRTRIFAAWGIIALMIAVYPANVYMMLENIGPEGPGTGDPVTNWVRLPFQFVFMVWAWWYTRPEPDPSP